MHILNTSQHGSLIPNPSKEENIFSWTEKELESQVQNSNHVYVPNPQDKKRANPDPIWRPHDWKE
jgi:hypothetical protein